MKILAFGDHHGDIFLLGEAIKKEKKADTIICLGDFTLFSQDIELIFEELNTFTKKLYLTFGNHEDEKEVKNLCKFYPNINFAHKKLVKINDWNFLFYGGDGFSKEDKTFEKVMKKLSKKLDPKKTILVTHGPPHNTKIDVPYEDHHSGNKSYRKFIEEFQPLLALAGHIHEGEHLKDKIGKTIVMNPGPDGTIINLETLFKRREKNETTKKKKEEKIKNN